MENSNNNKTVNDSTKKFNLFSVIVIILCLLPVVGIHIIVWFNQLEWYGKHRLYVNIWYLLSSISTLFLYVYFG